MIFSVGQFGVLEYLLQCLRYMTSKEVLTFILLHIPTPPSFPTGKRILIKATIANNYVKGLELAVAEVPLTHIMKIRLLTQSRNSWRSYLANCRMLKNI